MFLIATMDAASTCSTSWNEELLNKLEAFHGRFLVRSEAWLDYAASVDLTTGSNNAAVSWKDEWTQFTVFGSWPELTIYQQAMMGAFHDGVKGLQSVGYWIWLTMRPMLYSMSYIFWRLAQVFLGTFLPRIQYCFIEILRFHLHLTWQQALGELAIILAVYAIFKLVRYLRRQQYLQRTQRFIKDKGQRIAKVRLFHGGSRQSLSLFAFRILVYKYKHSLHEYSAKRRKSKHKFFCLPRDTCRGRGTSRGVQYYSCFRKAGIAVET
jgi:hypothetical protein